MKVLFIVALLALCSCGESRYESKVVGTALYMIEKSSGYVYVIRGTRCIEIGAPDNVGMTPEEAEEDYERSVRKAKAKRDTLDEYVDSTGDK